MEEFIDELKQSLHIMKNGNINKGVCFVGGCSILVPQDTDLLAERANQVFGSVDIYVNNAGKMDSRRVLEGSVSDWEQRLDINSKGVLYGIHSVFNQHDREEKRSYREYCF